MLYIFCPFDFFFIIITLACVVEDTCAERSWIFVLCILRSSSKNVRKGGIHETTQKPNGNEIYFFFFTTTRLVCSLGRPR